MRTIRPAEYGKEWEFDGDHSWGYCKLHPTKNVCHVSIHADFGEKSLVSLKAFAKWLSRAAAYMEAHCD
jgi:hypothetical protein